MSSIASDIFSAIRESFSQTTTSTPTAPAESTTRLEIPSIDFSPFTQSVTDFSSASAPLTSAIQTLAQVDFGVINNGAASLLSSSIALGGSFGRFNESVNQFSQNTNDLISAINGMSLDGTITVGGNISVQPMTVNIAGLEAIEARLQGFGEYISQALAAGLAQANPGFDTSAITVSTSI